MSVSSGDKVSQLIHFIKNLLCFKKPILKCVSKMKHHPPVCFFSSIPTVVFYSFTNANVKFKINPSPIPHVLNRLKEKYQRRFKKLHLTPL